MASFSSASLPNTPRRTGISPGSAPHRDALRLRARIRRLLVLRGLGRRIPLALFLLGTAVLLLRILGFWQADFLLWGMALLAAAATVTASLDSRGTPSPLQAAAFLDAWNRAGGLLVSLEEGVDAEGWSLPPSSTLLPRLQWRGRRSLFYLGSAALYFTAALFLPVRYVIPGRGRSLDIGENVKRLEAAVELLREERILSPRQREAMHRKLERLRQDASGLEPGKTWESLDHLAKALERAARERAEKDLAALQNAKPGETLSKALADAGANLPPGERAAGERKLREILGNLARLPGTGTQLPKNLLKKLNSGAALSPRDLQKLAAALGKCSGTCSSQVLRLIKARLVPAGWAKLCGQCGDKGNAALLAYLEKNAARLRRAAGRYCCEMPGAGAPTRGRADAPMTWKEKTEKDGFRFKAHALPPASLEALKNSRLLGVSRTAPSPTPHAVPSTGGGLVSARAGGGSARVQRILPCHRRAVAEFFRK